MNSIKSKDFVFTNKPVMFIKITFLKIKHL